MIREIKAKTKYYYTISEVCKITGLKSHVLRFWEKKFPQLHPKRKKRGNRYFTTEDIEIIKKIKYLLYDKKFTIDGAKKRLKKGSDFSEMTSSKILYLSDAQSNFLKKIKNELNQHRGALLLQHLGLARWSESQDLN